MRSFFASMFAFASGLNLMDTVMSFRDGSHAKGAVSLLFFLATAGLTVYQIRMNHKEDLDLVERINSLYRTIVRNSSEESIKP